MSGRLIKIIIFINLVKRKKRESCSLNPLPNGVCEDLTEPSKTPIKGTFLLTLQVLPFQTEFHYPRKIYHSF